MTIHGGEPSIELGELEPAPEPPARPRRRRLPLVLTAVGAAAVLVAGIAVWWIAEQGHCGDETVTDAAAGIAYCVPEGWTALPMDTGTYVESEHNSFFPGTESFARTELPAGADGDAAQGALLFVKAYFDEFITETPGPDWYTDETAESLTVDGHQAGSGTVNLQMPSAGQLYSVRVRTTAIVIGPGRVAFVQTIVGGSDDTELARADALHDSLHVL